MSKPASLVRLLGVVAVATLAACSNAPTGPRTPSSRPSRLVPHALSADEGAPPPSDSTSRSGGYTNPNV